MNKSVYEENLETRAQLFKALGHPARLLILNLIATKPRHGEELAAILRLKPATISHHLGKLVQVGLLAATKTQYYQMYALTDGLLHKTLADIVQLPQLALTAEVTEDAYRHKVLKAFFKHGRLLHLPAQHKKRRIILEKLLEEFEPNRTYHEREVNQILLDFHEDVATLRREMIIQGLMTRARGIYRRAE